MDWDLKGVNYVYIEVVNNKKVVSGVASISASTDVIEGLFAGLKITETKNGVEGQKFVLIQDDKKKTHVLNLQDYTIMSLEKLCGDVKKMAFFRSGDEDQEKAYEFLETTVEALVDQKRNVDGSLSINVDSYDKLPDVFTGIEKRANKNTTSTSTQGTTTGAHNRHVGTGTGNGYRNQNAFVKREPKIRFYRRKTKKPDAETLTKMKEMIKLIAEGDYKAPDLPPFKCDLEADAEDSVVTYPDYGGY